MSEGGSSRGGRRTRRTGSHSAFYRATQEASRALYHCNYCHKDISDNVRIKCADCGDFDLCVECFSVGVETSGHSNSHSYRVMDNLSFPIFHPSWGSDEELLLLEAIDIYGLGNWAAVAEHVGTKTKEACQAHYFQIYIQPPSCPLPTPAPEMAGLDVRKLAAIAKSSCGRKRMRMEETMLQHQQEQQQQQAEAAAAAAVRVKQERTSETQLKQEQPDGSSGDMQAADDDQQEEQQQQQKRQKKGQDHVLGKGAKRQHNAEETAAEQQQQQPVHPVSGGLGKHHPQQAAKQPHEEPSAAPAPATAASGLGLLSAAAAAGTPAGGGADAPRVRGSGPQLDMATGWHPKRFEFEPEWDNDAEASIAEIEFKEDDTPEEVAAKLRLLEIYNKRLDERARRQSYILEHGLLNVRRMQGLDKRRMAGERERYAQMRVFARYQPPGSHEGLVDGLLVEGRLRMRIAELQAHRAAGRRTMAEIEEAEIEEAAAKKKAGSKSQSSLAMAADEPMPGPTGGRDGLGGYRSTASALNVWRQHRGLPLDITGLPGVDKLSAKEAELCANARILPAHYLSLKDVMMRDAEVHGHISRMDARSFFRLDSSRSVRVWELLCANNWLKGTKPEEAEDKRRLKRKGLDPNAVAAAGAATAGQRPSDTADALAGDGDEGTDAVTAGTGAESEAVSGAVGLEGLEADSAAVVADVS